LLARRLLLMQNAGLRRLCLSFHQLERRLLSGVRASHNHLLDLPSFRSLGSTIHIVVLGGSLPEVAKKYAVANPITPPPQKTTGITHQLSGSSAKHWRTIVRRKCQRRVPEGVKGRQGSKPNTNLFPPGRYHLAHRVRFPLPLVVHPALGLGDGLALWGHQRVEFIQEQSGLRRAR
jgi:hypothetical protein